jgi:benzoate-CoA ligase
VVLNDRNRPDAALLLALNARQERARRQLAGFYAYYPRWIEFRRELPMTATGKVQRFKLREDDVVKSA